MATRSSEDERIYQQIEKSATYLNNATYATFLSFFNDLVLQPDNLGGQFYPLTTVAQRGQNEKPFIIGILPPSVDISGRLLDRSMSIAREDPSLLTPVELPTTSTPSLEATTTIIPSQANTAQAGSHKWARGVLTEAFRKVMHRDPNLAEIQYLHSVAFRESSYGRGWDGAMAKSNNWGAVHCSSTTPGAIEHIDVRADGSEYTTYFRSYPTPVDGAADVVRNVFSSSRPKTAQILAEGGTVFDACYAMRREHYYEETCPKARNKYGANRVVKSAIQPDLDEATKACARECITIRSTKAKAAIDAVALANGDPEVMALGTYESSEIRWRNLSLGNSVEGDTEGGSWATDGSQNAQNAAKEQDKTSGTPLNATDLGKALTDKQRSQIAASQLALQQLQDLPPLRLLVNPQRFSWKESKIVSDGNRSRSGPIVEHWGDDQSKLSASGMLAAFYAMDAYNASGPGITRTARNFSAGYQNFQALYLIYRNNAAMYLEDYAGVHGDKNLSMLGSVYIYYDNILHIGSFDSFDITETDEKPYTLEYSFEFSTRVSFLLDRQDDVSDRIRRSRDIAQNTSSRLFGSFTNGS